MSPKPALERLVERPELSQWESDELISLAEAVALLFPKGPLSIATLRRMAERGDLAIVTIGSKVFTTIKDLRKVSTPVSTEKTFSEPQNVIAEMERLIADRVNQAFASEPVRKKQIRSIRLQISPQRGLRGPSHNKR